MGVKLLFVMEGEPPKLKAETMSKRTEMRFGGFQKKAPKAKPAKNTGRGRFNAVLREVCLLLHLTPWFFFIFIFYLISLYVLADEALPTNTISL